MSKYCSNGDFVYLIVHLCSKRLHAAVFLQVGETGVGEQVPIRMQQYIYTIWMYWDENDEAGSQTQGTLTWVDMGHWQSTGSSSQDFVQFPWLPPFYFPLFLPHV